MNNVIRSIAYSSDNFDFRCFTPFAFIEIENAIRRQLLWEIIDEIFEPDSRKERIDSSILYDITISKI